MNRSHSSADKDVFFEPWECPLMGVHPLGFSGMLEVFDIRFFLEDHTAVYVVTIPRRSAFRLVDETCLGTLGKLLVEKEGQPPLPSSKTWKAWGTPFLKELDAHFEGISIMLQ